MKKIALILLLPLLCLPSARAQAAGTVTTISSLVALDPNQLYQIIITETNSTTPLVNPSWSNSGGTFTLTADRVLTPTEIAAVKAACTAALFQVSHN